MNPNYILINVYTHRSHILLNVNMYNNVINGYNVHTRAIFCSNGVVRAVGIQGVKENINPMSDFKFARLIMHRDVRSVWLWTITFTWFIMPVLDDVG